MAKKNSKKLTRIQNDHKSNQLNPNKGTPGTNPANAHVHGLRGKQLNPNQAD